MNKLTLVKSEGFGTVACDIYRGQGDELYMTREQIGRALEYADPQKAMDNLHARNAERLNQFSVTLDLRGTDGKTYSTTVYTAKGVYEICRYSKQPNAHAFYDWVYGVIEDIRKGNTPPTPERPLTAYQRAQLELKHEDQQIRKAQVLASICTPQLHPDVYATLAINIADFLQGNAPRLPNGTEIEQQTYPVEDRPRPLLALPAPQAMRDVWLPSEVAQHCGVREETVRDLARRHNMVPPKYESNRYSRWARQPGKRLHNQRRIVFTAEGFRMIARLITMD